MNEVWLALEEQRVELKKMVEEFKKLEGRLNGTQKENKENHHST